MIFVAPRRGNTPPVMVFARALGHYAAGQKSLLRRLIATTSVQKVTIAGPVSRLLGYEVFLSFSLSLSAHIKFARRMSYDGVIRRATHRAPRAV